MILNNYLQNMDNFYLQVWIKNNIIIFYRNITVFNILHYINILFYVVLNESLFELFLISIIL